MTSPGCSGAASKFGPTVLITPAEIPLTRTPAGPNSAAHSLVPGSRPPGLDCLDALRPPGLIPAADDDMRTFSAGSHGDRPTDVACGTGDQRRLAVKSCAHRRSQ